MTTLQGALAEILGVALQRVKALEPADRDTIYRALSLVLARQTPPTTSPLCDVIIETLRAGLRIVDTLDIDHSDMVYRAVVAELGGAL